MEDKKREVKLSPSGATPAEHVRNVWAVTSEFGVTKADIEAPDYWAHIAGRLRPRDRIEVMAADGSFYAEYLVTSCDRTWAKVAEVKYLDLTKASAVTGEQADLINAGYEIKWRGPKKWSVLRRQDRAVLQEGLHSEADGNKWLAVHLNSQGIAA